MQRYSDIDIQSVLSQKAPFHTTCPFSVVLTPSSPTKHPKKVTKVIESFKPNITVFDAAGSSSHLALCKKHGIKTVFICPREKKIRRAFAWRRLRCTDRVWISQPAFAVKPFGFLSRLKLLLLRKPSPLLCGPIFAEASDQMVGKVLERYSLEAEKYIIVNAGSGGHLVNGQVAIDIFLKVAIQLALNHSMKIVVVKGLNSPRISNLHGDDIPKNVIVIDHAPIEEFNALLKHSKLALLAGGSAILQALCFSRKIVAVPLTREQRERMDKFSKLGLLKESDCEPEKMYVAVEHTLQSEVDNYKYVSNGLSIALEDFDSLVKELNDPCIS